MVKVKVVIEIESCRSKSFHSKSKSRGKSFFKNLSFKSFTEIVIKRDRVVVERRSKSIRGNSKNCHSQSFVI